MEKSLSAKSRVARLFLHGLFLTLFPGLAFASQWAKIYGDTGSSESIQQTSDGGYVVAGGTCLAEIVGSKFEFKVIKLNEEGDIVWQKVYNAGFSKAKSIQEDSDGGYIVSGEPCVVTGETWILKLDKNGDVLWGKSFPVSSLAIQRTPDRGYIVTGGTYSFGTGESVGLLAMKLDGDGNVVWQKAYGGGYGNSVRQTPDGGYIIIGNTSFPGMGSVDLWVLKLDRDGVVQWQKSYGGTGVDWASSIQLSSDGGYIVTGSTNSFGTGSPDQGSIWVLKLDMNGSVQWQRAYDYGEAFWNVAKSIQQTSDGGYILIGKKVAIKLDNMGNIEWQGTYRNGSCLSSIQKAGDDAYILAGGDSCCGNCSGLGSGFFILKLDRNGDIPDCSIIEPAHVTVTDTEVIGIDTAVSEVKTDIAPNTGSVTSADLTLSEYTLCSSPSNPDIRIDPQEVNFHAVLPGESTEKVVTITNKGSQTVTVEKITLPSDPRFAIIGDNCSGEALVAEDSCSINLKFFPSDPGHYEGVVNIILNDPYKSVFKVLLYGGTYITLVAPSNGAVFDVCSLTSPAALSWDVAKNFERYEVSFSRGEFKNPIRVRLPKGVTNITLKTNQWKQVMLLPGLSGGKVYWIVSGMRADRSVTVSETRSFYIDPPEPVQHPVITNTSQSSLLTLSWENDCNTKFKVWFGSDEGFSKKTTYTFTVKNPNDNAGDFLKALTSGQWKAIRRLVNDQIGSTIYWYIESWDGLGRYAKTDVMNFVLEE